MQANEALRFPKPFIHDEVIAHIATVAGERMRARLPDPDDLLVATDHVRRRGGSHGHIRALTRSNDRPDVTFRYQSEVVVVEVGTLSRPFKWLGQFSMVHAQSAEKVRLVPRGSSPFAEAVVKEVRAALEPYRWPSGAGGR